MNTVSRTAETARLSDLNPAEARLIEYLRDIKWGSVEITVQNSLPVLVRAAVQTIKLT